jgi:hypothetical protein
MLDKEDPVQLKNGHHREALFQKVIEMGGTITANTGSASPKPLIWKWKFPLRAFNS